MAIALNGPMQMDELLILVDGCDYPIGFASKARVHRLGILHRAFSIFVFDDCGRLLLQQRASGKYHSAGLWSNTCCGHPRKGEDTNAAAYRRLREEMGFGCELHHATAFLYWARLPNGLIEHEYDHIYVGTFRDAPQPDPDEVSAWAWLRPCEVMRALDARPDDFTVWFRQILRRMPLTGFGCWQMPGRVDADGSGDAERI